MILEVLLLADRNFFKDILLDFEQINVAQEMHAKIR